MLPRIRAKLVPNTKGHLVLSILFNDEVVARRLIENQEIEDGTYHPVMRALANAEDEPLHTLATTLESQLSETLDMIEMSLTDEYKRVIKIDNELNNK